MWKFLNMCDLKVGDKIIYQDREGKVICVLGDSAYIRLKYARADEMVAVSDLTLVPPPPKTEKKKRKLFDGPPPIKLTGEQRMGILKNLVDEESIRANFKREIIVLARLIRKFPHVEFLLEGFKPVIKAKSLLFWIDRPEVEQMYRNWAIDLTCKREEVILSSTKIGEDIVTTKRPRNLLDLLG